MYVLKILFVFISIGLVNELVFKRTIEDTLIVGITAIIGILFCGYMLNILNFVYQILFVFLIIVFIISLYFLIKNRTLLNTIKRLFSIPALSYYIYLIFVYYIVRNNTVMWGDGLTYWGALPKTLFYRGGTLQLKEHFQTYLTDYIPGMPLYSYFLQRINGRFDDGLLFWGYAALAGAIVLPVLRRCDKWWNIITNIFILYFLPLIFFNTGENDCAVFYKSLYIDSIIGITVGTIIWSFTKEVWNDNFLWCRNILLSMFLVMIKASGIAFVAVSWLVLSGYLLVSNRKTVFSINHLLGLIVPIMSGGIWQLLIKIYGTKNTVQYSLLDIFNLELVRVFTDFIIHKPILSTFLIRKSSILTSLSLWLMLQVLMIVLVNLSKESKKSIWFIFIHVNIQFFAFVIGLYALCVGAWNGRLLSCERYISTVFEMEICVIVFLIIECASEFYQNMKRKIWVNRLLALVGVAILLIILPLRSPDISRGSVYPIYLYDDYDNISKTLENQEYFSKRDFPSIMLLIDEKPQYSEEQKWIKLWYGHLRNMLGYMLIDKQTQLMMKVYYTTEIEFEDEISNKILRSKKEQIPNADYVLWLHGHYTDEPIFSWELYNANLCNDNELILSNERLWKKD